jgi:hypothetical protein
VFDLICSLLSGKGLLPLAAGFWLSPAVIRAVLSACEQGGKSCRAYRPSAAEGLSKTLAMPGPLLLCLR